MGNSPRAPCAAPPGAPHPVWTSPEHRGQTLRPSPAFPPGLASPARLSAASYVSLIHHLSLVIIYQSSSSIVIISINRHHVHHLNQSIAMLALNQQRLTFSGKMEYCATCAGVALLYHSVFNFWLLRGGIQTFVKTITGKSTTLDVEGSEDRPTPPPEDEELARMLLNEDKPTAAPKPWFRRPPPPPGFGSCRAGFCGRPGMDPPPLVGGPCPQLR